MSPPPISVTAVIAAAHARLAQSHQGSSHQPTSSPPVVTFEGQVARVTGTHNSPLMLHSQALNTFHSIQGTDTKDDPIILWLAASKSNEPGNSRLPTKDLTSQSKEQSITIIIDSDDDKDSDANSTISWSDSDREMDQEDHISNRETHPLIALLLGRNTVMAGSKSRMSGVKEGEWIQVFDVLLLVEQRHEGGPVIACIGQPKSTCRILEETSVHPKRSLLPQTGASLPLTLSLQQPLVNNFDPIDLLDSAWDHPIVHTIESDPSPIVNLSHIWTLGLESSARKKNPGDNDGVQKTNTIQRHLCSLTNIKTCVFRAICAECENEYRNQDCVFGCSSKKWRLDIQMECSIGDGTGEATLTVGKDQEAIAWTLLGLQKSTFMSDHETRSNVCLRLLRILSRRGVLSFKSKAPAGASGISDGQVESMDNDVSQRAKEEEKLWLDICLGRLASQSVRRGTFILHATVAPTLASSSSGSKSSAAPFLKTSVLVGKQYHLTLIPSLPSLMAVGIEWIKPAREAKLLANLLHNS